MERRKLLVLAGSSTAAGLAGCLGGGGDSDDGNNTNGNGNGNSGTATFEVSLGDIADVSVGEDATIPYTVENTGDGSGTQDIVLSVGGEEQDSTSADLESGGTSDGEFTYTTTAEDAPSVDITISSDDDEATGSLSVLSPDFNAILGDIADVSVGSEATIPYTVVNDGEGSGSQDIVFSVDGTEQDTVTIGLEAGASENGEFTYTPTEEDSPSVTITIASDDDEAVGSLTVLTEGGTLEGQFRATSTGGFISIGEDSADTAEEEGFALPPTDAVTDPIIVEGQINDDGTWESTSVDFPPLDPAALVPEGSSLPIDPEQIDVEISTPEGFSGDISQEESASMTVGGPLRVDAFINDTPAFNLTIDLSMTTETSGQMEGSFDTDSNTVTVVDNESPVPEAQGESSLLSAINDLLELPADAGTFWVSIDFSLENIQESG